jgi:CheY-like chemotaxis protein
MPSAGPRIDRVLLVTARARLRHETSVLIESMGYHLTAVDHPHEADTYLRRQRVELVILDLPAHASTLPTWQPLLATLATMSRREASGARVLLLTDARHSTELRQLFDSGELTNFLVVKEHDGVDIVELMVTVAKILSGDVFGLHQYMAANAEQRTLMLTSSAQKEHAIDLVKSSALAAGCNARIATNIAAVVDELATNAFFNAPVDAAGSHIYAHLDRRTPVVLPSERAVIVRIAWDQYRFGIAAQDQYGSLGRSTVMNYMKKCFHADESPIHEGEGGAGIGLYMTFNLVNQFVVNLEPGKRSEALGLVSISSSYRQTIAQGRSFNLFVARHSGEGAV